jgi:hypothetical protein
VELTDKSTEKQFKKERLIKALMESLMDPATLRKANGLETTTVQVKTAV